MLYVQIELSPSQSEIIAEKHTAICGIKSVACGPDEKILNLEFPTDCLDIDWRELSEAKLFISNDDDRITVLYLCATSIDTEIEDVKWQKVSDFL